MTYEASMNWLVESRKRGILPGLTRIRHLLAILGNPQDGLRILHVAGTNGKGSTCAFLESILRAAGHHTGFFSSPWLIDPEEMFRLDGEPISRLEFADLVGQVAERSVGMGEDPGLPTEYEIYAAMAFLLFRQRGCTAVVLETCMGGSFDTTNAYAGPNLAVLTKISLDHMGFLGMTLGEIARHKAGIMRPGCRVVSWPQDGDAAEVISQAAKETNARLTILRREDVQIGQIDESGTSFSIRDAGGFHAVLPGFHPESPGFHTMLPGVHQAMNAALALLAYRTLMMDETEWLPDAATGMRDGIARAKWPCRFEILQGSPLVILDSAHNPDGISTFVDTFRRVYPGKKATLVFGAMKDKDVAGMLVLLAPITEKLVLLEPESPRAMPLDELYDIAARTCCTAMKRDTMEKALASGFAETPEDGVLAAVGSIYFIGRFKELVLARRPVCK